jgi:hypothetical protein
MVKEARKLAIEADDHQWPLSGTPVGIPSRCQLHSRPSLKINLQTHQAVGF